jgi:glyoxylase-like metal-dependent hydrolase (beta-lactamase superfamily II)
MALTPTIQLVTGAGSNVLAVNDGGGITLINSQLAENASALEKLVKTGARQEIKYIINTHWYPDQTGGNIYFGSSATIIAHETIAAKLASDHIIKLFNKQIKAAPVTALPDITFTSSLGLTRGSEQIRLDHISGTNTDGTTVVLFKNAKIAYIGDLCLPEGFPIVDTDQGGSVAGLIAALERILKIAPSDVRFVATHGAPLSRSALTNYLIMLRETLDHVRAQVAQNRSLEQILAAGLPAKWKSFGSGVVKESDYIKWLYATAKSAR